MNPPIIDIGRLPVLGPHCVGRDTEFSRLETAWEDPGIHVYVLVAFGGVGKTALIAHWLDRLAAAGWRGAQRVLDWSFYSQGATGQIVSAEPFLDYALRFFGDLEPSAGSAQDRGRRLAALVRCQRTLLILDGVEPLQYTAGPLAGRLKDSGLATLLKGLAAANPGLCILTTRERIADLNSFPQVAPQHDLEELSWEAGVKLLRLLKVNGKESDLHATVEEVQGHALTLTLLGNYLHRAWGGDIRRRIQIDLSQVDKRQGGHAFRVVAAYAQWFGEGPELAILRLLGLFDCPADADSLAALRAEPPIPHLTDALFLKGALSEEDWQFAVSQLRENGLLAKGSGSLDAHPLVRAYFSEELATSHPEAWRAGHLRLYNRLCEIAPYRPRTGQQMQLLFSAVLHGCQAGLHEKALREVYLGRIQRNEHTKKLDTIGSEVTVLTALAGFFEHPWDKPSAVLKEEEQAFVLNEAAVRLSGLGLLKEAAKLMKTGLERSILRSDWTNAARQADQLSELTLTLGEIQRAIWHGEQSVELADYPGNSAFQRMARRTTLADALNQKGHREKSAKIFCEAEEIQSKRQPKLPLLYSVQGYQYCDLLLDLAESLSGKPQKSWQVLLDLLARATSTLKLAEREEWLLDSALDHLTLGRTHLLLASMTPAGETDENNLELIEAQQHLDKAVNGLRLAGQENYLPRGLLARAGLRRVQSDFEGAGTDLREAQEIAEGGSMRLFLCDAHLEWSRLHLQQADAEAARPHVAIARELVDDTGYGRREQEVASLEKRLAAIPFVSPVRENPQKTGNSTPQLRGGEMAPETPRPAIFISYSHADEKWKDRLVKHLKVLELEGELEVWDDRRIDAGDDWFPDITREMERAKVAVLLISADFLTSKFIRSTEVPSLLARRQGGGLRVIPLIVHPCAWQNVGWLAAIQCRPRDGRPLSKGSKSQVDTDLAALALEISKLLRG